MKLFDRLLNRNRLSGENTSKEKYLFVFAVSFLVMMVCFMPVMIYCKGFLFYYGDFNSQQLMFYHHVQTAVKNGTLNWDWGTDLGSSYLGSYAFYLMGSPFFWVTTIFPEGWAPYMIPWLLALKTAVAAVTAYAFIRRFVKNTDACAIGALLYALNGFQIYNVFFNHFHDVTALFPLMLLALEMAVVDNKRGVFGLTVALMAVVNYFFFTGQVTFLIIYFIFRCFSKDFKITFKKFVFLAIESVLGVCISAFMLLPSVLAILENPRLTEELSGLDLVIYSDKTRIYRIIQSFFMVSDPPARANLFPSEYGRWASIAGYMPMFSMAGVIAFMKTQKKHWAKRVVAVCILFALVPVLNTSFYMFNSSYYARWYYMPILIMAMMTAYVVEKEAENHEESSLKKGVPIVCGVVAFCLAVFFLPTKNEKGENEFFKIAQYTDLFIIQIVVTLILTGLLIWFVYFYKSKKLFYPVLTGLTVFAVFLNACANITYCSLQGPYPDQYISKGINGGEQIDMEKTEGEFYRLDTSPYMDNYCMYWGYSSMRAFQSVVTPSIMEFYIALDMDRDVASRIETKYYQLRSLLSVKYYVSDDEKVSAPRGFTLVEETKDFLIYENENYLPMGFAYDHCLLDTDFEKCDKNYRVATLINNLILTEQQFAEYSDIISYDNDPPETLYSSFQESVLERKSMSCHYFKEDNDGFTAKISLSEPKLVFFSVPYDKGWTATVNGKEAEIEKVSNGMMAVKVEAGEESVIRFDYEVPGFRTGIVISISGAVLLAVYVFLTRKFEKKEEK